ncbi:MAG: hypothetical protein ACOYOL_08445 [Chthoniobacterales bacterium]
MQTLRRSSRIFWTVAAMLLATGQLTHALEDHAEVACESRHADEESHHCCHAHAPASLVNLDSHPTFNRPPVCGEVGLMSLALPEPPVREIDHPPQLS